MRATFDSLHFLYYSVFADPCLLPSLTYNPEPHHTGAENPGGKKIAAAMQTPPATPFADIITSLAGLHQEQHQQLLAIKEEQDQRFAALLRGQQEDRELFRSWIDREVRATPPVKETSTPLPLNKMGPQDDPEAFIDLFERSAEDRGWPTQDWPMRLIPLLSGEAQVAAH
ncbi:hypothetical protein PO909_016758 [Leuciscus waleckii]